MSSQCDLVQVENMLYKTQHCDLVQVDPLLYNKTNTVGDSVAQVENISCKATALGSNLVQVDSLLTRAPAQGSSVDQVDNCYISKSIAVNSDNPKSDQELVQVGDFYNPSIYQGESLNIVICSRGIKRKRS